MHPRMLAFGLGVLALAAALRAAILVGGGRARRRRACGIRPLRSGSASSSAVAMEWRTSAGGRGWPRRRGLAVVALMWTWWRGALTDRLAVMDPDWLAVLAEKDYLFPTDWPRLRVADESRLRGGDRVDLPAAPHARRPGAGRARARRRARRAVRRVFLSRCRSRRRGSRSRSSRRRRACSGCWTSSPSPISPGG